MLHLPASDQRLYKATNSTINKEASFTFNVQHGDYHPLTLESAIQSCLYLVHPAMPCIASPAMQCRVTELMGMETARKKKGPAQMRQYSHAKPFMACASESRHCDQPCFVEQMSDKRDHGLQKSPFNVAEVHHFRTL